MERPARYRGKSFRLLLWTLLPVCAFLIGFKLLARDDGFEFVSEDLIPYSSIYSTLRDGRYFWVQLATGKLSLWLRTVKGGPLKLVGSESFRKQTATVAVFNDKYVTYGVVEQQPPSVGGGGGISSSSFFGSSLAPTSDRRPEKGERRDTIVPKGLVKSPSIELHRMSLNDGHVEILHFDTQGRSMYGVPQVLAERGLFWIRSPSTDLIRITNSQGVRYERPAVDDLMFSPMDGGPAERVIGGMFGFGLMTTRSFVLWISPRVYPDTARDLHCLRIADRHRSIIKDYGGGAPIEIADRFYWNQTLPASSRGGSTTEIFSAAQDGTDQRVEVPASPFVPGTSYLTEHNGRIFTFLAERPGEPLAFSRLCLVELAPSTPARPRRLLKLPAKMNGAPRFFGDDYLYFVCSEDRRNIFDFISPTSTARVASVLYRWRIPD